MVTAPINKYNIQSEDFKFPGHTDSLDKELEGNALMLMVQDNLRVGLLTDHIPVNDVAEHLLYLELFDLFGQFHEVVFLILMFF